MGRTIWNLFIALINATLILVILCLWLLWEVLSTAESVSTQLAAASENIAGSRNEIAAVVTAIDDLRTEVAALETRPDDELAARLDALNARLAELTGALDWIRVTPETLIDSAVRAAFQQLGVIAPRAVVPDAEAERSE